jgi:tetratricopeptide (TPR) repeat protein
MKLTVLTLAAVFLLPSGPAGADVDPFYQSLLREGIQEYDRGDFDSSARSLRLACFGMLDEPAEMGGCLARLALAQDRANDEDGFQDTFRRLSEVEERFQGYTRSSLSAELRADLERRLTVRVPAATLRSIPAFRTLADRKAEARPAEAGGKPAASPAHPRPTVPAPATAPTPAAAAPTPAITAEERDRLGRARKVLAGEAKVKELRQAFDLVRAVADSHPESVEAQYLAAETAYRISNWKDAARYFQRGGEPSEDQPELLFYMAVALYESGAAAKAAEILKRALPNLQRTPYVDAYARKILG